MPSRSNYDFRKRFLIPFWVLQILWTLIQIGATAVVLAVVDRESDQIDDILRENGHGDVVGGYKKPITAVSAAFIALNAAVFILTLIEMVLYCAKRLKPLVYLVFNVLKTTFWLVVMVGNIISAARGDTAPGSPILTAVILVCFIAPLIYGSVMYHHYRRAGPNHSGASRTYESLGLQGPVGNANHLNAPVNPFNDPSLETRSNYSGLHSHNASATEMGVFPDNTQTRYGDGPSTHSAEPHNGAANDYYAPYAPPTERYESYRAPQEAPSSRQQGDTHELGFGGDISMSGARSRDSVV
ncbi:MAG: hypothetical protein M1820_007312 [Bogoriella megaspora]|nr:MAG: hypothetical protein M1820_007312 [Bogoriella megaspora]